MKTHFYIAAISLAILLVIDWHKASQCESKGGVLLRGIFSQDCVRLERVR